MDSRIIPLTVVGLIFGVPVIAVVGHYAYNAWKVWLELNLKREMVDRGYSAQEIIDVLAAKAGGENGSAEAPPPWQTQLERPASANR